MPTSLEPFQVHFPDDQLDDLFRRLDATRWPDDPANDDWSYGVNADYLRRLVAFWREEYSWREAEQRINVFTQYRVTIGGCLIHFVRQRGVGRNPIPLILTHGWPWSFLDFQKVIRPLADPETFGGDPNDAFDVIVPSLPGHGFSTSRPGMNFWRIADLWQMLMTEVLGYSRYAASGGDWGALVSSQLGHKYPDSLYGVHLMHPMLLDQFNTDRPWDATARTWDTSADAPDLPSSGRKALLAQRGKFAAHYAVHVLDPQTLAYALTDSPVGLLAWLLERWRAWGDGEGDPERVYPREHMITTTMLYWLSGSIAAAMRLYADAVRYPWRPSHNRKPVVQAPTGVTFLGGENPPGVPTERRVDMFRSGSRAGFFNLSYLAAHDRGGHFGYHENPDAVIQDLRTMFRPLRQS